MKKFRYLPDVVSLEYNAEACVGCGSCTEVCPHQVFRLEHKKAIVVDRDACIECGACANNCAPGAITVTPGTGCATLIIQTWIGRGKTPVGGCCG